MIMKIVNIKKVKSEWQTFEKNNKITPLQYFDYTKIIINSFFLHSLRYMEYPICVAFYNNNNICRAICCFSKKVFSKRINSIGKYPGIAFNDFLYDSSFTMNEMNECINLLIHKYKSIDFYCIPEFSMLYKCLINRKIKHTTNENVCINTYKYNSYDEYFNSLSKNSRQHIRTSYNRIKKEKLKIRLEIIDGKIPNSMVKKVMELYLKRRDIRYKKNSIVKKYVLKKFHHNTIAMKKFDKTKLFILRLNNQIVAFIEGFITIDRRYIIAPRVSINTEFDRFSPGIIMINEIMKTLFTNEIKTNLDLSIGTERYKFDMGGECFNTYNFYIDKNKIRDI